MISVDKLQTALHKSGFLFTSSHREEDGSPITAITLMNLQHDNLLLCLDYFELTNKYPILSGVSLPYLTLWVVFSFYLHEDGSITDHDIFGTRRFRSIVKDPDPIEIIKFETWVEELGRLRDELRGILQNYVQEIK